MSVLALKVISTAVLGIAGFQDSKPCSLSPQVVLEKTVADIAISHSLFACPRCRRAQPPGPRKLPHPGGFEKARPSTGGEQ